MARKGRLTASLSWRLAVLIAVAIAPGFAVIASDAYGDRQQRETELRADALRQAQFLAADLERIVDGGRQLLAAVAELAETKTRGGTACSEIVAGLQDRFPAYAVIDATDMEGWSFCNQPEQHINFADRDWFQRAKETRGFAVGNFIIGRISGEPVITFAGPIVNRDGAMIGVTLASLRVRWLIHYMEAKSRPNGASLTITDRDGTVLVHLPEPEVWLGRPLTRARMPEFAGAQPAISESASLDGVDRITAFVPPARVSDGAFFIAVGLSKVEAEAAIAASTREKLAIMALGAVIACLSAWLVGRYTVTMPLQPLAAMASRWQVDPNARVGSIRASDEFQALGKSLDDMADAVAAREHDLLLAKHEAGAANRTKAEFLSNMSHELRTPLNAIIGFATVIREGSLGQPERAREYGGIIEIAGQRLLTLVDDILDLANIEEGKVKLVEECVDLQRLAYECLESISGKASEGRITLRCELPGDLPWVKADVARLRQVLSNVLSNAVKFTPPGGHVRLAAETGAGVTVSIADSGVGMTPQEADRALEAFRQVDGSMARKHEGAGLGLPLAKRLIELHGGRLSIDSVPSAGTTVWVQIPAERVCEAAS